jgi:hypothetical protein
MSFQALGRLSAVSVPVRFFTEIGQACGCLIRSSANELGQGMQIASTEELGLRSPNSGYAASMGMTWPKGACRVTVDAQRTG